MTDQDTPLSGIGLSTAAIRATLLIAGLMACVFSSVEAQVGTAIVLEPSNGVGPVRFTQVTSVRELRDGRVLIADRIERRLYCVDFEAQVVSEIGRVGPGPREYESIGRVWALGSDSTLLTEGAIQRRWHLLDGVQIVTTVEPHVSPGAFQQGPLGADTLGHVLGVRGFWYARPVYRDRLNADSLVLLLVDRATETIDTIAILKGAGSIASGSTGPRGGMVSQFFWHNPLAAEETAMLFPDGWVAVARPEPYRVDWRTPAGVWRRGSALPRDTVIVTKERMCEAELRYVQRPGWRCQPDELAGWPEIEPPFLALHWFMEWLQSPEGYLVVPRAPVAAQTNRWDFIDREGMLAAVLTLPASEHVVGFGIGSVYVTVTDAVGLKTLQRHPWTRLDRAH